MQSWAGLQATFSPRGDGSGLWKNYAQGEWSGKEAVLQVVLSYSRHGMQTQLQISGIPSSSTPQKSWSVLVIKAGDYWWGEVYQEAQPTRALSLGQHQPFPLQSTPSCTPGSWNSPIFDKFPLKNTSLVAVAGLAPSATDLRVQLVCASPDWQKGRKVKCGVSLELYSE